jgi:hypothetical protein
MDREKPRTLWLCPECGEQVPTHYGPPMMPARGHYHDDPAGEFVTPRVFHAAEPVEVIPADAPNVLSEEEARVLRSIHRTLTNRLKWAEPIFGSLIDRLKPFAEGKTEEVERA